jgi:hypothetical protein
MIRLRPSPAAQSRFVMPNTDTTTEYRPTRRILPLPKFQFSLARLLIAVTVIAVVLGFAHVFGDFVGAVLFAFVCCVLPTPLIICAVFARGDIQAFAIGALVPWWTLIGWMPNRSAFSIALWLLFMPVICGIVATITRRWIQRFGGK